MDCKDYIQNLVDETKRVLKERQEERRKKNLEFELAELHKKYKTDNGKY